MLICHIVYERKEQHRRSERGNRTPYHRAYSKPLKKAAYAKLHRRIRIYKQRSAQRGKRYAHYKPNAHGGAVFACLAAAECAAYRAKEAAYAHERRNEPALEIRRYKPILPFFGHGEAHRYRVQHKHGWQRGKVDKRKLDLLIHKRPQHQHSRHRRIHAAG